VSKHPNLTRVKAGVYVVRTQAGFRKATKEFWKEMGREDTTLELSGWPTAYPCLLVLNIAYQGYDYITIDTLTFNQLHEILEQDDTQE
jgi:hypothetical protein